MKGESNAGDFSGLTFSDQLVLERVHGLKPLERKQVQPTHLNNSSRDKERLSAEVVEDYWTDPGTFGRLWPATNLDRGRQLVHREQNSAARGDR